MAIAAVQPLQRAVFAGDRLGRETAPAEHADDFFKGGRGEIGAVLSRRQSAQRSAQKFKLLASLLEALGETVAAPVMPGVAGFHCLAVGVEQAEVKVEAVGLMPAKRSSRTGKATADGTCCIETDQVEPVSGTAD